MSLKSLTHGIFICISNSLTESPMWVTGDLRGIERVKDSKIIQMNRFLDLQIRKSVIQNRHGQKTKYNTI